MNNKLAELGRRLLALFHRRRFDGDLEEEMRLHQELREQEQVERGVSPEEAHYATRRRFGNKLALREESRNMWGWSWLESFLQDVRYGLRQLRRNPGFTIGAVFALALGIGVNTAVFTAYKAFVARPLDARDPGRMVNFALRLHSGAISALFSYPDYEDYRNHLHSFSGVIAFCTDQLRLTSAGRIVNERPAETRSLIGRLGLLPPVASNAEFASTFFVSRNYFSVLGVTAVRGRTFEPRGELAATPSVLISENYWRRRFGGDPSVLGRTIRLNGAAVTIVGVTPHNFVGTSVAVPDFWLPLNLYPLVRPESKLLHDRDDLCCRVFGRLAPGVTMAQAQTETTLLASRLRTLHNPNSDTSQSVTAVISPGSPFPGKMNSRLQLSIVLIMVAVGMVLVIACANASSLQLARATTRQPELAMRLSLGASRSRLCRQLLTESTLLALVAGCIALPLTWILLRLAATWAAGALPTDVGVLVLNVNPDFEIFAYVLAISVFAGILLGLAPAIESSRSTLFSKLRQSASTSSVRGRRLLDLLIAAQVAISLVLMIAASMLTRSAIHAIRMNTGYDGRHVVDLSLQFPEQSKYTAGYKAVLVRELRTRIAALPGVAAITNARAPDDNGGRRAAVSLNGVQPSARNMQAMLYYTWAQPNYFQTLGIRLLSGSGFPPQAGQPEHVAILSESAARRLWPRQNPIGRTLRLCISGQFHNRGELLPDGPTWEIIGVARDTRGVTLDGSDSEQVYLPLPADHLQDYPVLVRTASDPALVIRDMDAMISAVDPNLVATISSLQEMLHQTDAFLIDGMSAAIASAISLFGLLLASMGIYSTVSYIVVLRTREVGIRMAMGAKKRDILALMIRKSAPPVLAGLLAGIALAGGASRLLRGALYGVGTIDAASFAGASLLFLIIALVATLLPSRRAIQVDPVEALRCE
jgi:predicted permease